MVLAVSQVSNTFGEPHSWGVGHWTFLWGYLGMGTKSSSAVFTWPRWQWEPGCLHMAPASTSQSCSRPLLITGSLSCPFVCGLWPFLGHRLESKYKKKRQSTFQLKSPRKLIWLLNRNGSNKGREEYCFYSFWDIKHLENVIDWQGLIYHLYHPLCSHTLYLAPHNTQADTHAQTFFSLFSFLSSSLSETWIYHHSVKEENSCGYL